MHAHPTADGTSRPLHEHAHPATGHAGRPLGEAHPELAAADAVEPGQVDAGTEDAHWPDDWHGEQCPNCNQPLGARGCGACGWPRPWEEIEQ